MKLCTLIRNLAKILVSVFLVPPVFTFYLLTNLPHSGICLQHPVNATPACNTVTSSFPYTFFASDPQILRESRNIHFFLLISLNFIILITVVAYAYNPSAWEGKTFVST